MCPILPGAVLLYIGRKLVEIQLVTSTHHFGQQGAVASFGGSTGGSAEGTTAGGRTLKALKSSLPADASENVSDSDDMAELLEFVESETVTATVTTGTT